jgi:outer membrane protein TolC
MCETGSRARIPWDTRQQPVRDLKTILGGQFQRVCVWLGVALTLVLVFYPQNARGQGNPISALTLHQAVRFALDHSPDLQTASAEIRKREGLAKAARSPLLPQIDLLADASRYRLDHGVPAGANPLTLHFDNLLYTTGAEASFLVWDFGKTSAQLEAVRQRLGSSKLLLNRRREEVIFSVASLFLKAETYEDLIEAGEARKKSLETLLDHTQRRVKAGRAVPLDLLKVQTQLARIESDIAALRAGREGTVSALLAAIGWEAEIPRLVKEEVGGAPETAPKSEGEYLREALARRPDLAAVTMDCRAAASQAKSARRSLLPHFDIHAAAYDYGSNSPVAFGAIIGDILPQLHVPAASLGHWQGDWVVGGRITFPLFDGGRRRGEIIAAKAQQEQAESAVRLKRLAISREVRTSLANLSSDRERVKSLSTSVAQAQEALRLERLKYEAGRSEVNFVLDAEAALLTNDSLLREARRATQIDHLALDLSLGSITETSLTVTTSSVQ